MASKASENLDPDDVSTTQLQAAVQLYPTVVDRFYKSRIKDEKKLNVALENDKWRFEDLPKLVEKSPNILGKSELERLVQWKITHGVYRPFLPGMVRKNDEKLVKDQIAATAKLLASLPSSITDKAVSDFLPIVTKALDAACKLQGVGPATGTLILNVLNPANVPFFQDEMYGWLFPKHDKLKYNNKEYLELFRKIWSIRQREKITAGELEKAAFVIMHIDLLEADEKSLMNVSSVKKSNTDQADIKSNEPEKQDRKRTKKPDDEEEEESESKLAAPKRRAKKPKT